MYYYPYCGAAISCAEYLKKNTWVSPSRLAADYSVSHQYINVYPYTKGYNYLPVPEWNGKLFKKGNLAYAYIGLSSKIAWDTTGTAPYTDYSSKNEGYSLLKLNNTSNWGLYFRAELDRYQETVIWKKRFSSAGNFTVRAFSTINNEETSEAYILIKN